MALAGAAALAAGLFVAPTQSGAVLDELPEGTDTPETSIPGVAPTTTSTLLPGPVQDVVDQVMGIVAPTTTTSTTTSSTSTTSTSSTTTTSTSSTTTTTTGLPIQEVDEGKLDQKPPKRDKPDEVPEVPVDDVVDDLEELIQPVEPVEVEEIVEDYERVEFADYTPVWGSRSTTQVLDLLEDEPFETQARVLAPFPVAGPCNYTDTWGAPRFSPTFHLHEGTDVFCERGTPVIASVNGEITRAAEGAGAGGTVVYLTADDGTYFYYAHLDEISPLIQTGMRVEPGTVLGTVGNTGNAVGTPPHLHFEIHPGGGEPVPPAPYLDAWLASALEEARGMTGTASAPSPIGPATPNPLPAVAPGQEPVPQILNAQSAATVDRNAGGGWLLLLMVAGGLGLVWRRRRRVALAAIEEAIEEANNTGSILKIGS